MMISKFKFSLFGLLLMFSLNVNGQSFNPIIVNPFGLDDGKELSNSKIYFADIDGDGDLDNFATTDRIINFRRNIGNAQNPVYANAVTNPFELDAPADFTGMDFVDIDNDGDLDLYQMNNTELFFCKNNGTATNPSFTERVSISDVTNDLTRILDWGVTFERETYDGFIFIDFVDIDNDGDQDLFAGGYSGDVFFFRNIGTRLVPSFAPMQINPFGFTGFGKYQFAFPSFVDIDNDGDQDCFVTTGNSTPGELRFFRNTGSVSNPSFNLQPNTFGLNLVGRSKIRFYDIDADGDNDAFIESKVSGDPDFNIHFQRNTLINTPAKITQSITGFAAIPTQNGATYTITGVTSTSGNPVVFNSTDPTVATVSGNIVTLRNVGICKIIASQVGNAVYASASNVTQTLTVVDNPSKTPQTITGFNPIPFQPVAGVTYTLSGITGGTSGISVVFTSSNPAVAEISGNAVTILNKGVAEITASQAGNHLFSEAVAVTQILTVGLPKAPQTITGFTSIPTLTVGQTYTITGVTGGVSGNLVQYYSMNTRIATVVGNTITAVGVGDVDITAFQQGNDDFIPASQATVTLSVSSGGLLPQNISGFNIVIPRQSVGRTYTISGVTGGGSGNPVVFSIEDIGPNIATISGNVVTFNGTGSVIIIATQAGNASYLPARPRSREIRVTLDPVKAFQNIVGLRVPTTMVIGNTYTIAGVTGGASGNPIVYTSSNPSIASVSGNIITAVSTGRVLISANQEGNGSYNPAITKKLCFQVTNTSIVLLPQNISGFNSIHYLKVGDTYTISGVTGGASANPVMFLSSDPAIASISGNTITAVSVGVVTITASQAGNTTYDPATSISQNLIVISTLSVENLLLSKRQISLYPNPFQNELMVELPDEIENATIQIYTLFGQEVLSYQQTNNKRSTIKLDVSGFKTGIYIVKVNSNKGTFQNKLIKSLKF